MSHVNIVFSKNDSYIYPDFDFTELLKKKREIKLEVVIAI